MSLLGQVFLYMLTPVAATMAGGVLAAYRPPKDKIRSYVQHFAAGVLLAAVAGEILPEVVGAEDAALATITGLVLGVVLMLGVRTVSGRLKEAAASGLVIATAIDLAIDGFIIDVGFVAGKGTGLLLALALSVALLFVGLSLAASLGAAGASRRKVIMITLGFAFLPLVGALVSVSLLAGLPETAVTGILAFGAVAILYLAVAELLVEADEADKSTTAVALLFAGFVLVFMIEVLL